MAEALGRLFDISTGVAPVSFDAGASTGKRVALKNAGGLTAVIFVGAASSGSESLAFTVNQHTASSGGSSATLAVVDHYYTKLATTLAGTETWTRVNQTAGATVTIAGADAAKQGIVVIELDGVQLADTYKYVSIDAADPGTGVRIGGVLYLLRDLKVQRRPQNLVAPLS